MKEIAKSGMSRSPTPATDTATEEEEHHLQTKMELKVVLDYK